VDFVCERDENTIRIGNMLAGLGFIALRVFPRESVHHAFRNPLS